MSVFSFATTDTRAVPSSSSFTSSSTADCSLLRILGSESLDITGRVITCAEKGDVQGIVELYEEGAQISQVRGLNNYTALHYAVRSGSIHLVAELIRRGVPIEARTSLGETALHLAAYSGRLLVAEQLIDKGAEIDAVNDDGESPLFYAARKSMPALVRLLLQRNARPDLTDKYGELAREHASDARTISCFDMFSMGSTAVGAFGEGRSGMLINFPHELLLRIVLYLDAKSVSRAACVSGKWHRVCESTEIWNALGVRRWERVLQSTIGFGPAPASSFRPRKNSSKQQEKKNSSATISVNSNGATDGTDNKTSSDLNFF